MRAGSITGALAAYPAGRTARDRFVLARRGRRPDLDPFAHQGVVVEPERSADGTVVTTATVFLTGRECPWRCVMCDLWQHATAADTPAGAIPTQVADAVGDLRRRGPLPSLLKLYNAGSFFDRHAVPPADDAAIVQTLRPFARVVVESHPALVGDRTWRLRDDLAAGRSDARLEVAMGLETAHPDALDRINKGITAHGFAEAARSLVEHDVDVRVFLLVHPPFVPTAERDAWLARSVAFAFACGATAVSLVPTRPGEGAMRALADAGWFDAPRLPDVERAAAVALAHARGRVFVDTWDLARVTSCRRCADARHARLARMNLEQALPASIACDACGEVTPS